jgi:hypothetical protein
VAAHSRRAASPWPPAGLTHQRPRQHDLRIAQPRRQPTTELVGIWVVKHRRMLNIFGCQGALQQELRGCQTGNNRA